MLRNPLTLAYGVIGPLLPLAFVPFSAGKETAVAIAISAVLMVAWLLPVYYNILSIIVTRRDELVLKRLRTGRPVTTSCCSRCACPASPSRSIVALLAALVATVMGQAPGSPATYLLAAIGGSVHVRRPGGVDGVVDPQRRGRADDQPAGLHAADAGDVRAGRCPSRRRSTSP